MYKKISVLLKNIYKSCFLDQNEKKFTQDEYKINFKESGEIFLIQCPEDYFFVSLYSLVIKNEKNNIKNIYGLLTIPLVITLTHCILIFPLLIKIIMYYLRKRKWKKIYKSIGIKKFIEPPEFRIIPDFKNFYLAAKVFVGLKNKRNINEIRFDNIKCGDLIYDTCLRYNKKLPTVNVNDLNLLFIIYKCFNYIKFFNEFLCIKKIDKSFISYSVYIYHGISTRVLSSKNIPVYCSGNYEQMFKLVNEKHNSMMANFKSYKKEFEIKFGKKEINEGFKSFSNRFEGIDDNGLISSMSINPFKNQFKKSFEIKLDGVLFLHDFYDSHRIYGNVIFNDFYEWTLFTLNLIRKYKLNIGIKPHPHQISPESNKVITMIKNQFSDLKWIDSKVSNNQIFKSGIKFGISHHGSVISELAYWNIVPISCSENPCSSFDFTYEAKSVKEYKKYILNFNNLKLRNRNQVGQFYYMHYINKKSDYLIDNKNINGIHINKIDRFNTKTLDLLKIKDF
tara:strand:- start:301 stop:1821 length:1521 start_codon:yes stop_codon:yes gene_type:complete